MELELPSIKNYFWRLNCQMELELPSIKFLSALELPDGA
jgi:hypothetical protein